MVMPLRSASRSRGKSSLAKIKGEFLFDPALPAVAISPASTAALTREAGTPAERESSLSVRNIFCFINIRRLSNARCELRGVRWVSDGVSFECQSPKQHPVGPSRRISTTGAKPLFHTHQPDDDAPWQSRLAAATALELVHDVLYCSLGFFSAARRA